MTKSSLQFSRVIILTALVIPIFALAHGTGQTFQKEAGDLLIDVDIDELTTVANSPVRFSFRVYKNNLAEPQPEYTHAWVRISRPGNFGSVYSGLIGNPEFGSMGMNFTFPKGGEYELSIRFEKDGEEVTEDVSFPLTVEPAEGESRSVSSEAIIAFISGGLMGAVLVFLLKKKSSI
jgi:hypothetical protein